MGATQLLRHSFSEALPSATEDEGLAEGSAASLYFLKYLFNNNQSCFLTYKVRIGMGLDSLGLCRLERKLFTCLKHSGLRQAETA